MNKELLYQKESKFTYCSEGREASDVGKVTWFVSYWAVCPNREQQSADE